MKLHNCQTLPADLRAKQNEKWKAEGAIAELVDNSFGPLRGDASEVAILFDKKAHTLIVIDNGKGMDHIGRLFQSGNSGGRGAGDIGEYGSGGSKAILWLASHVDVATMRNGKVMRDAVTWVDWFNASSFKDCNVSDEWLTATLSNTPTILLQVGHGTVITMKLLRKRKIDAAKIRRELAFLYSPGLRNGKRIVWTNMADGEIVDTIVLTEAVAAPAPSANTIDLNFEMLHDIDNVMLSVKGAVSYSETTPQADSKIHIGYVYRNILSTTDCYRSPDGDKRYPGVGISGWIDLGEEWRKYLALTKDEINDEVLHAALMGYLYEKIKSLLEQSQRDMFSMELDDLALGLEKALNQRTGGNVTFLVKPAKSPGELPGGGGNGGDGGGRKIDPEPGDREHKLPPKFKIAVQQQPDIVMKGHLCRSDINKTGDSIIVYINEDHDVIQEALKARPINRMLLNSLMINEIANQLALDKFEPFIDRLFKRATANAIIEIDNSEGDRARVLTRQLIDRVRSPISLSEAAE